MPDIFRLWPTHLGVSLPNDDIVRLYNAGFAGALKTPEPVKEELQDFIRSTPGGYVYADDACHAYGLAGSHAGKLVLSYPAIELCYPGALPGPGQDRGDCVSHNMKNACLTTMCNEIVAGKPDEISKRVEEAPKVDQTGIRQGVLSTETFYWYRRHGGDGWHCPAAVQVALKESGSWLRQSYPELGIDLTKYSGSLAGKYGRNPPTGELAEAAKAHLFRTSTESRSFEEIRDLIGNGYGVSSCGSEGFGSSRDDWGVASRKGSWAHAMAYIGADDRPETHSKYGGPLVLVLNSWGPSWISGPRKISGTELEIPEGSFWARWKDVSRREVHAISGHNGWPRQMLPDWGWGVAV